MSPRSKPDVLEPVPVHPTGLLARSLLAAIRAYKLFVSPHTGGGCRFTPSCADYTAEAIRTHGAIAGTWLGARRIGRCRPWGGHGFDPVPNR